MQEADWISRYIAPLVTASGADSLRDDVAILSADGVMIVNLDTLVEGTHFLGSDPLETVGRKLVRVNVSDIFAKGAVPIEALLSIAWPRGRGEGDFASLIRGLGQDLATYDINLIGGDTVGSDDALCLTLTLTGRCLGNGPVRRGGGEKGDNLWVSGEIGWGHLGLQAARSGQNPQFAARFQVPEIGTAETAQTVADYASASMDVSDGLLMDALRLGKTSGCGVEITLDQVPLAAPSVTVEAVLAQCTGGDDYQVLITAPKGRNVPGFTQIGHLLAQPGLKLSHAGQPVNAPVTLGFEH